LLEWNVDVQTQADAMRLQAHAKNAAPYSYKHVGFTDNEKRISKYVRTGNG
jgi:hypothetical protein